MIFALEQFSSLAMFFGISQSDSWQIASAASIRAKSPNAASSCPGTRSCGSPPE